MSYITAIGTAVPEFRFAQSDIASFMETRMSSGADAARKIRAVFRASGISRRHSVLEDYGKTSGFTFYPETQGESHPGTKQRMALFRRHALPLSEAAVRDMLREHPSLSLSSITHLIVVSCTGMYAPGLDIDLVRSLGLSPSINRTSVQFMGCYAAFNALRIADALCRSDANQKVMIVCTELCSIHFQQEASDDNILANALFADGSACLLVEATPSGRSMEIKSFHSTLSAEGMSDMAWNIGDEGFQMRLTSYIPALIGGELDSFLADVMSRYNGSAPDIHRYAVHPGGVKILDAIRTKLNISRDGLADSYEVLRNYGNMSSATVVFVLQSILRAATAADRGRYVLGMGFGPGLTLESGLFRLTLA